MPRWWEAMAPRRKSRAWCRCTAVGRDRAERDGVGARCDRQGGSSIFTRSEMRLGKESGLEDTCSVFRKLIGRAVAASVLSHCQAVEEALMLAVSERVPKRLTERRERRAARRVPPLAHRTSRHGAVRSCEALGARQGKAVMGRGRTIVSTFADSDRLQLDPFGRALPTLRTWTVGFELRNLPAPCSHLKIAIHLAPCSLPHASRLTPHASRPDGHAGSCVRMCIPTAALHACQ
ncbi:hypothetical protein L1887_54242 [Cichorium endivia]|nr:hypothetical protein L1887_54242 [Cichorium endivia]